MVEDRSFRAVLIGIAVIAAGVTAAVAQPAISRDAVTTRTLAWSGGDRLHVGVNADVRYVQGANARVVITGPAREIARIVVDRGLIREDYRRWSWPWWSFDDWRSSRAIHIVVTAPHLEDVGVSGPAHLDLGRLAQDRLELGISGSGSVDVSGRFKSLGLSVSGSGGGRLGSVEAQDMSADISGSGWIKASGAADALHLSISGSGHADLGALAAQDVSAHLSGSGSARLSPKRSADLGVSGSGVIHLLTQPARISTHRSGSGRVVGPGASA